MKLPKFDFDVAQWDRYKAFHINYPPTDYSAKLTQFSTGELIVHELATKSDNRKDYPLFGLRIVGTDDDKCPLFKTPDGEVLKRSWLNHKGQQVMLIDEDHGTAVRLEHRTFGEGRVPVHLRGKCLAYFPGVGEPAVAGKPLVDRPRIITKEERTYCDDLLATCKAWDTLREKQEPMKQPSTRRDQWALEMSKPIPISDMLGLAFGKMSNDVRQRLAQRGWTNEVVRTEYDRLVVV